MKHDALIDDMIMVVRENRRMRRCLEQIEHIIAEHEQALVLPDADAIKLIWKIAREGKG